MAKDPEDAATPDMFPETLPFEVEVTGDAHKHAIGKYYGLCEAMDALEVVPEAKRVPGFSYAMAIIQRELAEAKAEIMGLNLRAVAASGRDINQLANVALHGQRLICTPLPPAEEA
jgi:hypothetical protein